MAGVTPRTLRYYDQIGLLSPKRTDSNGYRVYGTEDVDRSNAKLLNLSPEKYAEFKKLTTELNETLKAAVEQGDPSSETAQRACELHKKWLCFFWDSYSKEAHMGVTQMYVDDPRFKEYYEKIAPGCAEFLRDAVSIYCEKQ